VNWLPIFHLAESSSNSGAAGGVQVEQAYNPLDVLGEVDPTVDLLTALTAEEIASEYNVDIYSSTIS